VLILVLIAASVLGISALSHLKTATPDYREGVVSNERPLSLNPLVGATDPSVRDLGAMLYRRLLRLDDRAVPIADLASAFTVSADGLSYHLPLRAGQLWSDGRRVTVADVLATVAWVQSPGFGDAVTAAPWRDVHVQAVGDGVTFDLAGPRASFPAQLTQLPILPMGTLSHAGITALPRDAALPMATSGPFYVVSSTSNAITLFPNPHAAVHPHLNQVEIDLFGSFADAAAAYRAGTVDSVLATDPVQRAQLVAAGGSVHNIATFRFVDLLFNERGLLADAAVRQAIAAVIDRSALVAGPLRGMGVPLSAAIPAGIAWAAPKQAAPAANPQTAAGLLDAAGWKPGRDGVRMRGTTRLQVRLAVADVIPLPDLAAGISAQLAVVGISAQVISMPTSSLRELLVAGGGYDMAVADWDNGPDPDVSTFWRSTAVPPAGFNVSGGAVDPFLDQALDRLSTLSDTETRVTAAVAVSSQLADDLPAVFLETPELSLVVHPGITLIIPPVGSSAARYNTIASWRRA
jgi:peptide/nickel transport system substrate-binding protein